jgi:hypothetical protein
MCTDFLCTAHDPCATAPISCAVTAIQMGTGRPDFSTIVDPDGHFRPDFSTIVDIDGHLPRFLDMSFRTDTPLDPHRKQIVASNFEQGILNNERLIESCFRFGHREMRSNLLSFFGPSRHFS